MQEGDIREINWHRMSYTISAFKIIFLINAVSKWVPL